MCAIFTMTNVDLLTVDITWCAYTRTTIIFNFGEQLLQKYLPRLFASAQSLSQLFTYLVVTVNQYERVTKYTKRVSIA